MAKIKFGSIITDSRGRIGGQVIRGGANGPILYQPRNPTDRKTNASSIARSLFATYSKQYWTLLTAGERDDWRALAAANPYTNIWGDEYALTGLAYYVKLNTRLVSAGEPDITTAPADQAVTAITTLSLAATAPNDLTVTWTASPIPADHSLYIFASPVLSPAITNYNRQWKLIATLATATASPQNVYTEYAAKYRALIATKQYAIKAAFLHTTNAALSPYVEAAAIAA